jgi:hypothetical protein
MRLILNLFRAILGVYIQYIEFGLFRDLYFEFSMENNHKFGRSCGYHHRQTSAGEWLNDQSLPRLKRLYFAPSDRESHRERQELELRLDHQNLSPQNVHCD